jgi:hypothetical protein
MLDKDGNPIVDNVKKNNLVEYEGSEFIMEETTDGDESTIVKPWMNTIKPPTGWSCAPPGYDQAPDISISLEHCHGYRV